MKAQPPALGRETDTPWGIVKTGSTPDLWSNHMCFPVSCPSCKKTTWDGCGMHVDAVMANVPEDRKCECR
jgi:hypothetical protein